MIKFEYNMLVLNNAFSNEDVQEINAFSEYVRSQERERIIALLNEMLADNWDWAEDCDCDGCIRINKMFALIKGEN
jgi:hypothetical protein